MRLLPHVHPADGLLLTLIALPLRVIMRGSDTLLNLPRILDPWRER